MADFNLVMPKLGESVQEATITRWLVKPGDMIQEDDVLLEIATDKVDSEIPSPVAGKILNVLFAENALVPVGEVIAVINTEGIGEVAAAPAAAISTAKAAVEPPPQPSQLLTTLKRTTFFRSFLFTPGDEHCSQGKYFRNRTGYTPGYR